MIIRIPAGLEAHVIHFNNETDIPDDSIAIFQEVHLLGKLSAFNFNVAPVGNPGGIIAMEERTIGEVRNQIEKREGKIFLSSYTIPHPVYVTQKKWWCEGGLTSAFTSLVQISLAV